MYGTRLPLIAIVCAALIAFAAPSAANFVGLDRDGDMSCDSTDMQIIVESGDVGNPQTVDIYFDDFSFGLFAFGCTFCVKDSSMLNGAGFVYDTPTGWTDTPFQVDPGTISDFLTERYPDHKCWLVQATDFNTSNPIAAFPSKIGTFTFTPAEEGCLSFVIDGANCGWLSTSFISGIFGEPGETCDTVTCPSQVTPVVIDVGDPACPLPDAMLYENYLAGSQFTASGGVPPYNWVVDGIPADMRIVPETGVIEGMPTEFGGFPLLIRVFDDAGQTDTRACSIYVDKPRIDQAVPSCPVPGATYGTPYPAGTIFQLANNPTQDLTWSATDLPDGLEINATTGELEGAPVEWGWDFDFTVFLNGSGPTKEVLDQRDCSISVVPILIDDADPACPIPNGTLDEPYEAWVQFQVDAPAGYNNEHRWEATGLPLGMQIHEEDGTISGMPTEAGDFTFIVALFPDPSNKAVDSPMDTRECSITIEAPASISVTTIPPVLQTAAPAMEAFYSFEVENVAGSRIELHAQARSYSGWGAMVTSSIEFSLAPGEIDTVNVSHLVPADVECPGHDEPVPSDTVWLEIYEAPDTRREVLASDWGVTTALFEAGVEVSVLNGDGNCAEPGDSIYVQYNIENTGFCEEWFDVEFTFDKPGWSADVVLLTPPLWISGETAGSFAAWIHVPENAECGEQVTLQCKLTGQNFGAADSVETGHCATSVYEVSIRDISGQGAAPGDSAIYCFEVKNEGNCDIIAYPEALSGWPVNFTLSDRLITVGQSDSFCVRHVVPAGTPVGSTMDLTFIVSPGPAPEKNDTDVFRPDTLVVTTTATEGCDAGVEITPPGGGYPYPGDSFQASFLVTNTGADPDRFLLNADCPQGWQVSAEEDTTPVIDPGNDYTALVNVQVPEDALCTDQGWVRLMALSLCDLQTMDIDSIWYNVHVVYDYDVDALTEDSTGVPGQVMDYVFRITNNGNCTFPTGLSVSSIPAWDVTHGSLNFDLAPGASYDFPVSVTVPNDAVQGDEHKYVVCAMYGGNKDGERPSIDCDSTITRVVSGCEHVQPILSLGDYRTLDYTGPGGLWTVQVQLRNNGPGEARNISMEMHEDLSWLTIPDAVASYGNLPQGQASYGADDGEFFIFDLADYPGGSFNVWFDVSYEDVCGAPPTYQVRLDPTFLDPGASAGAAPSPTAYVLHANMPNPFNPSTTINFELPSASRAELTIYNAAGQKVKSLWNGDLPTGVHTFQWDGRDDRGNDVPSGTYFYSLKSGDFRTTKRMVLVR